MRVIITGAAGAIGSQIIDELRDEHQLYLVDRRPVSGVASTVADLSRFWFGRRWMPPASVFPRWWKTLFEGADVVVHLAAETGPRAPWRRVLRDNVKATCNVLEAAARYGVPRVVFASSHWAVRGLELELAPACFRPSGPKIGSDAPPRPITPYGVSKAFGEITGRAFVDQHQLKTFVAVRIGSYFPEANLERDNRREIRTEDLRSLLRRCVEAELTGFHVVYGVGSQPEAPFDLTYTRRLLSWTPAHAVQIGGASEDAP